MGLRARRKIDRSFSRPIHPGSHRCVCASATHLRRANSVPGLPRQGLPPRPPSGISKGHRGLPRVARVVATPRAPGGSTAIIDRFILCRALRHTALILMALVGCSGKSRMVEDARSAKPISRDAAIAASIEPYRAEAQFESGDVQIRVEWKDVPLAARQSTGRTPCGTPAAPAVSPTTTWGIPDAVVMVDVRRGRAQTAVEPRVVFEHCAFSPRVVVASSAVVVASAHDTPAVLSFERLHSALPFGASITGDTRPLAIYLPTVGHEVAVPLSGGAQYALTAGSETATVVAAATPYYAVTEASGQATLRQVPTGTHPITAWIPARAGQPARAASGVVRVTASGLAEVTLDMSHPL